MTTRILEPSIMNDLTFLGLECGGTSSFALLVDQRQAILQSTRGGPANLRLLSDRDLQRAFRTLAGDACSPSAVGVGMAGARTETDLRRIRNAVDAIWPGVPCHATSDLETALRADDVQDPPNANGKARVLVLSGTGSCCFGAAGQKRVKVGGWGHVLGDRGSGYDIGRRALRDVIRTYDRTGRWPKLGSRLLQHLLQNDPDELIGWAQAASKTEIAAVAAVVFAAAMAKDPLAAEVLAGAAEELRNDALACARRLGGKAIHFVLSGSNFLKQPQFAASFSSDLMKALPGSSVTKQQRDSVWGAVALARQLLHASKPNSAQPDAKSAQGISSVNPAPEPFLLEALRKSPTEQRNPLSAKLDTLSPKAAIELFLREDAKIPLAIRRERDRIEQAVGWIAQAFRRGGRLFYVGAGTSGRLGVLDASECPPTFRSPPDMVQGIIAGGPSALWQAVEGAEDDADAGARALEFRGVGSKDVVVGIAASGRTPFVWGALREAKKRGAKAVLLAFNPHVRAVAAPPLDLIIAPNLGPELLTGSTRLKAGTATKLILNLMTTLAMVAVGKVQSNLMIDVNASNVKLRDRAVRMVRELSGASEDAARAALEAEEWKIRPAVQRLQPHQRPMSARIRSSKTKVPR